MHASTILGAVALFRAAAALPAAEGDSANDAPVPIMTEAPAQLDYIEKRAEPTAAWVTVDDEGRPAETLTPSVTTIDGTTSMVDGAPNDITGTVFTQTYYGKITTSTGDPPNPTATSKHNEGAFARCYNMDGDHAPLCYPTPDSTLYRDTTYFVTWDPDFYNQTDLPGNSTRQVAVRLDYLNRTTDKNDPDYGDDSKGEFVKLDETDRVPADWGFLPLKIKGSYLKGSEPHNITLTLMLGLQGSSDLNETSEAIPFVLDYHRPPGDEGHHVENRDLIIALPVTCGSIVILCVAVCLWNRKTRRIQLGNIMSRSRHGYTGRKARRMFSRGKKNDAAIRLDEHQGAPLYEYSDHAPPQMPRRDSDLGSLAGSPITPTFRDQDPAGGNNAFRDELRRQEEERRFQRY